MTTKELRIGNYVTLPEDVLKELEDDEITINNHYLEVVVILGGHGEVELGFNECSVEFFVGDCKPIPLTEDWLEKLGFYRHGLKYFYEGWDFFVWKIPESENQFEVWMLDYEGDEYDESTKIFIMDIDYVHELQNLFFSLNKKELKIK